MTKEKVCFPCENIFRHYLASGYQSCWLVMGMNSTILIFKASRKRKKNSPVKNSLTGWNHPRDVDYNFIDICFSSLFFSGVTYGSGLKLMMIIFVEISKLKYWTVRTKCRKCSTFFYSDPFVIAIWAAHRFISSTTNSHQYRCSLAWRAIEVCWRGRIRFQTKVEERTSVREDNWKPTSKTFRCTTYAALN